MKPTDRRTLKMSIDGKPNALHRGLLSWASDCYFAMRASGLSPDAASRVIGDVIRERLNPGRRTPDPSSYLTDMVDDIPF